jgi:pyruvate dehydrogenase kinase 2/3/4
MRAHMRGAREKLQDVSIRDLLQAAKQCRDNKVSGVLLNAQQLQADLPIRLAKACLSLKHLPYNLSRTEPVLDMVALYEQSFREVLGTPVETAADVAAFTQCVDAVRTRHADVVPSMARGLLFVKSQLGGTDGDDSLIDTCPFLQDFLDGFFLQRMLMRILISQHIVLYENYFNQKTKSSSASYDADEERNFSGIVSLNAPLSEPIQTAVLHATSKCESEYGVAPDVLFVGEMSAPAVCIPHHVHHVAFELLKNAMRAVVEQHGGKPLSSRPRCEIPSFDALPPIEVTIAHGDTDYSFKVSDQGGGIRRRHIDLIWSYLHSTAEERVTLDTLSTSLQDAPLCGFGYGLPLSRIFARHSGGNLRIISIDRYGTDAYCFLPRIADMAEFE